MKIKVTGLDLETTGLNYAKNDRIIELGVIMCLYDTNTGAVKPLGKYIQRINPQRSISAAAQNIHGIGFDELTDKPAWAEISDKVTAILKQADILVAHNAAFDTGFLISEYERLGVEIPDVEVFCTMQNGRFATFDGSVPSLKRLCECFDIDYDHDKAHGAEYDILITLKCFFIGLKQGYFQLPTLGV